MTELLKAQGKASDMIKKDIQQVFFNQFIDTADSNTIAEFEKTLNLSSLSKTLDERRRIIKACLISSGKLSASKISDVISAYTGAETTVTFEAESYNAEFETLTIYAERGTGVTVDISDIAKLILNKIPAHIFYNIIWDYEFSVAIEAKLEIYNSDVPRCGLYACGQNIPFQ